MEYQFPVIAASFAALLVLLGVSLTVRVIVKRVKYKIDYADEGNADLAQAIRAHANFTEQAPLAIIILTFAEVLALPQNLVISLAAVLLLTRVFSAIGLSRSLGQSFLRQSSAGLTAITLSIASMAVLYQIFA